MNTGIAGRIPGDPDYERCIGAKKEVTKMTTIERTYNQDREDRNYFTIGSEGYLKTSGEPAKETLAELPCIVREAPDSIDELVVSENPSNIIKIARPYNPGTPDRAA